MTILKRVAIVIGSAITYCLFFYLNKLFFDSLEFSYGTNWIFIPSGIQLLIVLIAAKEGALGIVLSTFIIGLENYVLDSVLYTFITALIAGSSPLLARKICLDYLGIEKELENITFKDILKISFIFSVLSACLHQVWFSYIGKSTSFIQSLFVMAVGNLIGTTLVLFTLSLATSKLKNNNSSRN
jgi:hypothetical protein